jgi:hypothetical protein
MTSTLEITETIQDGMLKLVETSQRWTIGALKSTTGSFDAYTPDLSWIPFADRLPTPKETIDLSFGFAEKLLAAQHAFMSELAGLKPTAAPTPVKKIV